MKNNKKMRLVIKIGTQVISGKNGLNKKRIRQIIIEVAEFFKLGYEVILVSSGAIATGLPFIHFKSKFHKKIAAAVGQPLLMHAYTNEAKKHKIIIGQVLILSDDFTNRKNFKNLILNINDMLSHKVLPIINENDVMKRQDLRINDNDTLGAMVAVGVSADKLIILTNKDGLYTKNPDHDKEAVLIKEVSKINSETMALCATGKSALGVGGMLAKIKAAKYATQKGVETFIGNGKKKGIIIGALNENFSGTRFLAKNNNK